MTPRQAILVSVVSSLTTALLLLGLFGFAGTSLALPSMAPGTEAPQPTATPGPARLAPPEAATLAAQSGIDGAWDRVAPSATSSYLHVSGAAFGALGSSTQYTSVGNGCVYVSSGGSYSLSYPLQLPQGSIVTQVRLYFRDLDPAVNASLRLTRFDDGLSFTHIVTPTTAGIYGWGYASVELNHQIDYAAYSYDLVWQQPIATEMLQLCGVRVVYTPPSIFGVALPLINKSN